MCTVFLLGCGLRSSSVATRPAGQVRDAGAEPDVVIVAAIDGSGADRAVVKARSDASTGATADPWGSIDCQGSEEQINDCIINAPTKSGIPATRSKPTVTYQTCGAQ